MRDVQLALLLNASALELQIACKCASGRCEHAPPPPKKKLLSAYCWMLVDHGLTRMSIVVGASACGKVLRSGLFAPTAMSNALCIFTSATVATILVHASMRFSLTTTLYIYIYRCKYIYIYTNTKTTWTYMPIIFTTTRVLRGFEQVEVVCVLIHRPVALCPAVTVRAICTCHMWNVAI